jgi:hypothetical protein
MLKMVTWTSIISQFFYVWLRNFYFSKHHTVTVTNLWINGMYNCTYVCMYVCVCVCVRAHACVYHLSNQPPQVSSFSHNFNSQKYSEFFKRIHAE